MRTVATLAIVLMAAANCGDSGKSSDGEGRGNGDGVSASASDISYPDTVEGLESLVQDILRAVKNQEQSEARRLAHSLELSDHEAWFTETFGESHGSKLAADYAPVVGHVAQMSSLFEDLLKNEQTQVSVERFVRADDLDLNGYQSIALGAMKNPTALYSVRLSKNGDVRGFHLWSFVYSNGSFRWVGKMKPLREIVGKRHVWAASLPADIDPLELRLRESDALKK